MVRNVLGILLAVVGAAAAVWSVSRDWYGGRLGRSYQVGELFSSGGITGSQSGLWTGLFLPMLAAAVVTLLAVTARSRLLAALAGVLVLGFVILWMVRQGQYAGTLTAGAGGLGEGVGYAIGGGVLLLTAALTMRGRSRHGRRRKGRGRVDGHATADGGGADEEEWEHSETPQPYGPFGTTNGPHGAYLADTGAPHGPNHDPYYDDDSTPSEEWDPWGAGPARAAPSNGGPVDDRPSNGGPVDDRPSNGGPVDDRPADRWPGDWPADDRPPQGPQRQPPPPGTG